ncbi:MAG: hypothetical protein IH594_07260 [Bacteroidales bacterium]|nr:hypothetical protein [Bacteroidales bacterium]
MSVVYGFGGLRVRNNLLNFDPLVPGKWKSISFRIIFRENVLRVRISGDQFEINNEEGPDLKFVLRGKELICGRSGVFSTGHGIKI